MISAYWNKREINLLNNKQKNKGLLCNCRLWGWTIVPLLLVAGWEITARLVNQSFIFPPASLVFEELLHPCRDHYASGSLFSNSLISLLRVLIGFFFAGVVGVSLGLLLGASRILRGLLEPTFELLRPLCPIAWLPFAIVVFKIKTLPQLFGVRYSNTIFDEVQLGMIFVLFMGGFFPIFINTVDGVAGVRRQYLSLAKTLGTGKTQNFFYVYLPAALPMILTGLRQGIGLCWFVIIAAEMMTGSNSGIGYLLMYASDNAAMDIVLACMIIIAAVGATLNGIMRLSTKVLIHWHGKEN